MLELIFYFFLAFALAFLSKKRTERLLQEKKQDEAYFFLLVILLVLFAGLRTRYNDTITYIGSYRDNADTPDLKQLFNNFSFAIQDHPGFMLVNATLKSIGYDEHVFIFAYAAFTVSVYLHFLRKYSCDLSTSIFLFLANGYLFLMAGIKQSAATAIALLALTAAFNKQWARFGIRLFIASCFHPYVLLYAIVPLLLNRKPWGTTTYLLLILSIVIGATFTFATSIMSRLSELIGESYTAEELQSGTGVSFFRFLFSALTIVVCLVFRRALFDGTDIKQNVFFHLSLIGTSFMFLALFGNQILIGRIPQYFAPASCITLTFALSTISKTRRFFWLKPLILLAFFGFFLYENVYLKTFWERYKAISIIELFDSLFSPLS